MMDARKFLINLLYRATAQSSEVPGWSHRQTKNFSVQGNLNNLFDKTYDTNIDGSIVYGEPRNVSITASYQF